MKNMDQSKKEVAYVCDGSCKAQITQDQYDSGITKCGNESCNLKGKPFTKLKK